MIKKHPGVFISIIVAIGALCYGYFYNSWTWHPIIKSNIAIVFFGFGIYFITHYHVKWLQKLDKKYYRKDK